MNVVQVDVAIIGAGTAGLAAYAAARAAGALALLIEGGAGGTSCARNACMPSKLLIAAADAAHAVATAPGFGLRVEGALRVDGRAVMDRVRRERNRFVGLVVDDVAHIPAADRLHGRAVFADNHTLDVGESTRVVAATVVIATGSRPSRPHAYDALGDRLLVSDDLFEWEELPRSVAIIGAGIVGLELGQALQRLGVRVVVLGRHGHVGPLGDPAVLACATAAFRRELALEPDAHITEVHREHDRVAIEWSAPGTPRQVQTFDYALLATGRLPNVDGIGLSRTSARLDAEGVPVYDPLTTQTMNAYGNGSKSSPIFVAGDAGNFIPLLHEAADEGRIAGTNAARAALGKTVKPGLRRSSIRLAFTDPQIAIVGDGFRALRAGSFVTGRVDFANQGRARIMLRNKGLLNVYADMETGRFLGAEMVAPGGEHLAHLLAWALGNEMTVARMLEMPFYHPVLEEGLRTALRDAAAKLDATRHVRSERVAAIG
ncbi:MAG: dihydrolipoyl dehydrogenase [Casimicrobiaceae bacterium]